jgi:hypothetical protein
MYELGKAENAMVDFQFVDTLPQDVGDIYKNLIDGDFVSF